MLSKFGQFVRTARLQKNMLMSEMAENLKCSPSYLSAVEFGRRPVPPNWVSSISKILKLSVEDSRKLGELAEVESNRSRGAVSVSLENLSPLQEEVAMEFARKIRDLTEDELQQIKAKLVEEKSGESAWYRGRR